MSSQNPGCLSAFLNLFKLQKKSPEETEIFPYRLRDDFLSEAELSFYHVLKGIFKSHLKICTKVSLADIFYVTNPQENMGFYNKINRKHVDFLLCDPKSMNPKFAIELDDSSHQRSKRVKRDEFVDQVFETVGLRLVRVPVQRSYNTRKLNTLFQKALQGSSSQNNTQASSPKRSETAHPPLCPKCEVPMVARVATSGRHQGKRFYGCPNFPKCREIIPIAGDIP